MRKLGCLALILFSSLLGCQGHAGNNSSDAHCEAWGMDHHCKDIGCWIQRWTIPCKSSVLTFAVVNEPFEFGCSLLHADAQEVIAATQTQLINLGNFTEEDFAPVKFRICDRFFTFTGKAQTYDKHTVLPIGVEQTLLVAREK